MGEVPSGTAGIPDDELDGDIGRPDIEAMTVIRDLLLAEEPLVSDIGWNDPVHKRTLQVEFSVGIDAEWSRLDVTWYTSGAYSFHYVDAEDRHWRFDRHPNPHSSEAHFHEPPDADSGKAVASCISVREPGLVARAVLKLWRRAVAVGSFAELNTATDPP